MNVKFCLHSNIMVAAVHDDAKNTCARWHGFITFWENWGRDENSFPPKYFDPNR